MPSAILPLLRATPSKNLFLHYVKPLFCHFYLRFLRLVSFLVSHLYHLRRENPQILRVIIGDLASTPIPFLHLKALLLPLRVTLTHQCLSYFKCASRLPSSFPLSFLVHHYPRTRLKKGS